MVQKTCRIVQISVKYTKFGRVIKVNTLSKSGDERRRHRTASIRLLQVFLKNSGIA